jgi:hypothetical protein
LSLIGFRLVPNFDRVASIQSLQPPSASTSAPFAQSVPPTALPTTAPVSRSSHAAPLPPAHRKKPSQAQAISTPTLPLILVASTPTPQAAKPSIMTPSLQTPKSPKGKAAPKPKPPTRRKTSTKANSGKTPTPVHTHVTLFGCVSQPSTSLPQHPLSPFRRTTGNIYCRREFNFPDSSKLVS